MGCWEDAASKPLPRVVTPLQKAVTTGSVASLVQFLLVVLELNSEAVKHYRYDILEFLKFANKPLDQITAEDVRGA
jgi:hypothetical protein